MKVLLVQSYLGGKEPLVYPIGLACLVSSLRGHEIQFFDPNLSARPFEDLCRALEAFDPDVIGISLRNIDSTNKRKVVFYYPYLKKTIDVIKSCSDGLIVVGGPGFSMFASEIMSDEPRIDIGVLFEGEISFQKLLDDPGAPEKIRSLCYRKNGELIFTDTRDEKTDIERSALPDRKMIPVARYANTKDAVGVETKRGCALQCVYCVYGFLNGKKIRLRSPQKVVDEIELLAREGVGQFTFVDSVFNLPKEHAADICNGIIARGLKLNWSAWFTEKGLTQEFIELVKSAGCKNIILSPDGFSDGVLQRLGKNIRKHDILRTFESLRKGDGFEVSYNFFKNPPGQSFQGFLSLLGFVVTAKRHMGKRVHFEFNSMRIEPHTQLYHIALGEGTIRQGENLLYPRYFSNPATTYIEKAFNVLLRLKELR